MRFAAGLIREYCASFDGIAGYTVNPGVANLLRDDRQVRLERLHSVRNIRQAGRFNGCGRELCLNSA